jgi:cytochrome c-type biogenesis protein CcmE
MRRIVVLMLLVGFAGIGFSTRVSAQEKAKEKNVAAAQETRVRGTLKMIDKAASTMIVRDKSGTDRIVHFDSATEWTKKTEKIDPSEFKEGVHVICLGKYDEKGAFHATRIDLRYVPK